MTPTKHFISLIVVYCQFVTVYCLPIKNGKLTDDINEVVSFLPGLKDSLPINKEIQVVETDNLLLQFESPWYNRWGPFQRANQWSYSAPDQWSSLYPTCGGSRQSPIDITSATLKSYPRFTFVNYGNIDQMSVTNNGHTVFYSLPANFASQRVPYITGGGLEGQYNFVQFHLHWGSDSSKGSEHLIRSKRYAGELHLVHYNVKYGSFAEATKHSDGLAVLGVFIQVGNNENAAFQPLVNQLNSVQNDGDETTLTSLISFKDLLPSRTTSFYRYLGSLTTPGCEEIVIWTVFDTPITVSENQLAKFRNLKNTDNNQLVNNYRPTLPLNGRIVTYRSKIGCQISNNWPFSSQPLIDAFQYLRCASSFYASSFLGFLGSDFS